MKRLALALLLAGCSGPAFEAGSTDRVEDSNTGSLDQIGAESTAVDGSGGAGSDNGSSGAKTTDSGGTGGSEPTSTENTSSDSGGAVGTTGSENVSTTGDQSSSGGAATTGTAAASATGSATVNTVSTASTATVNTVNTVNTATSTTGSTSATSTAGTTGGSGCECDSTPDPDHENIAARLPDYAAGCCDGCHLMPAWTRCVITAQCFNDYNFEIEWGTCTGESDLCANHGLAENPAMNGGSGISACAGNVSDPEECSETSASTARCD